MTAIIEAQSLTKHYDNKFALNNFSFSLEKGRIMGLIGPNGAGKTTALRCLMGMTNYQGQLRVLGKDPSTQRQQMLREVAYIADTAILPAWITVAQLLEYTAGVHPKFDIERAKGFLASTDINVQNKISELSKGMVTQVHLALAISIDAKLLVLDEPTIGLDILYRKRFYQQLLNDYFDDAKTIIITTHQVEEIEHVLTDLLFIHQGKAVLNMPMDRVEKEFTELQVADAKLAQARKLEPIYEQSGMGQSSLIFQGVDREVLQPLGKVRTPSVADLFVAKMS